MLRCLFVGRIHDRLGRRGTLLCLTAMVAVLTLAPARAAVAAPCATELAALVEAKLAELGVPGAIVHVTVPGTCEWTATLGVGDVGGRRPPALDSRVRVGSITKTFTGTVVLQLAGEGRIRLDEPITTYVAGVPNGATITVRQLLQMTSGLYNYSEGVAFNRILDTDPQRVWTVEELLALSFSEPPYFPPGTGFHYSNTNSVLLGRLIETVTGNPLAAEFERRIFRPLQMRESSFPDARDNAMPPPHMRGYAFGTNVGSLPPSCDARAVGRRDVTHASPSWTWAAGGAVSTLHDLRIWARALALGTLLPPSMQAARLDGIPTSPAPGAPRYGLHLADYNGVVGHDGALPGFNSFIGHVPARKATIIVLANLYPDVNCQSPADVIAKLIGRKLGLFSPMQSP